MTRTAACLLALCAALAAQVRVGPYLQSLGEREVTICWQTAEETSGGVLVGDAPDDLDEQVAGARGRYHAVRVRGLKPGRTYYYAVTDRDEVLAGGDRLHHFTTAPKRGSRAPIRIWAAGDVGTGNEDQRAVRDAMRAFTAGRPPDFFLGLGDLAYSDGDEDEFRENFFAPYREDLRSLCCFPSVGNHETYGSREDWGAGEQYSYFNFFVLPEERSGTERYYSFDWGNIHVVSLDSQLSSRGPNAPMARWLKADLAATDADWLIASFHHPPYTKGSHDSDRERRLREMRENIVPILEAHGVDLVLTGHSHSYERSQLVHGFYATPTTAEDGTRVDAGDGDWLGDGVYTKPRGLSPSGAVYVVTGNGGKTSSVKGDFPHVLSAFSERRLGSCVIDVVGDQLTLTHLRDDGTVSDRFTIHKGKDRQPPAVLGARQLGAELVRVYLSEPVPELAAEQFSIEGTDVRALTVLDSAVEVLLETAPHTLGAEHRLTVRELEDAAGNELDEQVLPYTGAGAARHLVAAGERWRYILGTDDPGDWTAPDYDDASWPSGPSGFGYGDSDDATVLRTMRGRTSTVFTRIAFEAPGDLAELWLEVRYDDGFAAFLNGTRVASVNAPRTVSHKSRASDSQEDGSGRFAVPLDALREGRNVLAVVGLNRAHDSSDLTLEVELLGR